MLFWNIESEPYAVELNRGSLPQGWSIIFDPKNFTLDSTPGGKVEYIYLPYLKKSIGAKVVEIFVPVPENAASGKYFVSAVATTKASGAAQVNLVGQKKFSFEITVGGLKNTQGVNANKAVIIENPGTLETVLSEQANMRNGGAGDGGASGQNRAVIIENPGTSASFSSENATDAGFLNRGRNPLFFAAVAVILIIAWVIYRYE